MTSYNKYVFVGNGAGQIRIFDVSRVVYLELRMLQDESLLYDTVTCIDVSAQGHRHLVTGHKSGAVALWDLQACQMIKLYA